MASSWHDPAMAAGPIQEETRLQNMLAKSHLDLIIIKIIITISIKDLI
jgi:hypothetical protein